MGRGVGWGLAGLMIGYAGHCSLIITVAITVITGAVGALDFQVGEICIGLLAVAGLGFVLFGPNRGLGPIIGIAIMALIPLLGMGLIFGAMIWYRRTRPARLWQDSTKEEL